MPDETRCSGLAGDSWTFDELVEGLTRAGVSRSLAEQRAREKLGIPSPHTVQVKELEAAAIEDEQVREADRIVRALGGRVVAFSQKRASKLTPGIPDRRYYFPRSELAFWWEAKAEWGVQSEAQKDFQRDAEACREAYVLGELQTLKNFLVCCHLCTINPDGSLEPVQQSGV